MTTCDTTATKTAQSLAAISTSKREQLEGTKGVSQLKNATATAMAAKRNVEQQRLRQRLQTERRKKERSSTKHKARATNAAASMT